MNSWGAPKAASSPLAAALKRAQECRRDMVLAQASFYAGARAIWKVLGHLAADDEPGELMRLIVRRARQVNALQGFAPRRRRH